MVEQVKRPSAFWNQLIAEFEARADGISQTAFCDHHDVPYTTFYRRRKKFLAKAMTTTKAQASPFIEIELSAKPAASDVRATPTPMILEYKAFRLRMEVLPDAAWLAELLVRTQEAFRC